MTSSCSWHDCTALKMNAARVDSKLQGGLPPPRRCRHLLPCSPTVLAFSTPEKDKDIFLISAKRKACVCFAGTIWELAVEGSGPRIIL